MALQYDKKIFCDWVWSLAKEGLTEEEIAEKIGVPISTFNQWKRKYPEFLDSIKQGRNADAKVIRSLYNRAIGFKHIEQKHVKKVVNGKLVLDRKEITERYIPGDVGAQEFWLKNRDSENWKDKRDVDVEAEIKPLAYDMTVWAQELNNAVNGVDTDQKIKE